MTQAQEIVDHLYDHYDSMTAWEQRFLDRLDNQLRKGIYYTAAQAVTISNLLTRFPRELRHATSN